MSNGIALNEVAPEELLSRFIFKKFHITEDNLVSGAAFMPAPSDGKTSVFRIDSMTESEINGIATGIGMKRKPPNPLLGRANIIAGRVYSQKLGIESSADIKNKHANICGWPKLENEKLQIAVELANDATLIM